MNELLKQVVTSDRKDKAREEHSKRDDHRAGKRSPQRTIYQASLKSDECRENDEWSWEHVSNGNTVEKNTLRQPPALEDSFHLYKWNCSVSASEREGSCH